MKRLFDRALDGPAWPWLLLGLALRVAFAWKLGGHYHQTDELGFNAMALQFAETGTLGARGVLDVVSLVPAVLFGSCYRLFGGLAGARVALAVLGAALPWLIGRLTETVVSPRAGRLALVIAAVYPFFVYYSGLLMSESPYLLLSVTGLWFLCASLGGKPGWAAPAAAGFFLGLAGLCRAEAAYVLIPVWLAAAGLCAARRWDWKLLAVAALCWALPLGAMSLRNKLAVGTFTLDTHGGLALVHGVLYLDENDVDTTHAQAAFERSELHRSTLGLPDAERDAALKRAALRFMAEDPARTLRQWGRKFVHFWRFYPRTDRAYDQRGNSNPTAGAPLGLLVAVSLLFEPALILGGLAGLWALRRRWERVWPLWLWVAGTMALHMVSVSQIRYRLPVMPALLLGLCALLAPQSKKR